MSKKRLGISIYPEFSSEGDNIRYIEKASKYGFDILFLALLAVKEDREAIIKRYKPITMYAKKMGFEIHCDVSPTLLNKLGVNISMFNGALDLSFFSELGIDVMRLDTGMSELEEAFLSNNYYGIKVCMNAYMTYDHVGNVLKAGGKASNILGCHNYYPRRYTGVNLEQFMQGSVNYTNNNIRLQSFVTSQNKNAFGPHQVTEGLCTLEMHREWPIEIQVKHYLMMDLVDDILIGNCFATDDELKKMAQANTDEITFNVQLKEYLPESMKERLKIAFSRRQDTNDYLVRTLESRLISDNVESFNTVDIHEGDILIANHLYGQYEGEVSIALKYMKNYGNTNVVGHLGQEEIELLPYLKSGKQFRLKF